MKRKKADRARHAGHPLCGPEADPRGSPPRDRQRSAGQDPRRAHRGQHAEGERRARRRRELGSRHPGRHRVRADPDEGRDAAADQRGAGRLEEGNYGYCFECGDEIAEQRLRALPFAVRCKDCEEAREVAEQRERSVAAPRRVLAVLRHVQLVRSHRRSRLRRWVGPAPPHRPFPRTHTTGPTRRIAP